MRVAKHGEELEMRPDLWYSFMSVAVAYVAETCVIAAEEEPVG